MSIPGVSEAVVFGVPHADLGEEVMAVVVVEGDLDGAAVQGAIERQRRVVRHSEPVANPEGAAADQSRRQGRQARHQRASARRARAGAREGQGMTHREVRTCVRSSTSRRRCVCSAAPTAWSFSAASSNVSTAAGRWSSAARGREGPMLDAVRAGMGERCAGVFEGVVAHSPVASVEAAAQGAEAARSGRRRRPGRRLVDRDRARGEHPGGREQAIREACARRETPMASCTARSCWRPSFRNSSCRRRRRRPW